jgi:hypothetical protein
VVVRAWLSYRGPHVVVCPDNGRAAGVDLDVRFGMAAALVGAPGLRLKACSRWPEKEHCGQECLVQVEEAPDDCRVRSVLRRFYVGQSCVVCARPFDPIAWHDHKPAIRRPDGMTVEWASIRPEELLDELAAGKPVCWSCHMALRFRHEHADLVIERPHLPPR